MLNNFIYSKTKDLFLEQLEAGHVLDEAVAFIEDTKEIWNHGTYFDGTNVREYAFPKTGGLITGVSSYPLQLKSSSDIYSTIRFITNNDDYITFGFKNSDNPQLFFTNKNGWNNEYFLYHSGNFNPSDYLPLSGGTLTAVNSVPLTLKGSIDAWLKFEDSKGELGYFGFLTDKTPVVYVGGSSKTLLHSGNVGEYALKTDGTNGMNYGANIIWGDENANLEDYEGYSSGFRLLHYSTSSREYSGGIHVGTRYGWQLVRNASTETMRIRYIEPDDKSWGDWKTIAFTDSDITGTALKARNLVNSEGKSLVYVSGTRFYIGDSIYPTTSTHILGQEVFLRYGASATNGFILNSSGNVTIGSEDKAGTGAKLYVDGNVMVAKDSYYYLTNTSGKVVDVLRIHINNVLYVGYGSYQEKQDTYLWGKNIKFMYGEQGMSAMTITEEGEVNLGTRFVADAKFTVHGGLVVFQASGQSISLDKLPSNGLVLGGQVYTLAQYLQNDGNFAIQSYDVQNSTSLVLNLNPLGGAVNIASADAYTNVLGHLFASKDLYMSGFLMMNHGKEGIYMTGKTISWHNTNDAYTDSLLTFAKDSFTIHPSLYANGLANFSSRVLIGAVTDDTESALQVNGDIHVTGNIIADGEVSAGGGLSTTEDLLSYGVEWDTTQSTPDCTRIGNPLLHKSLPIQSKLRGCVANGNNINYYLYSEDWAYKEDGTTPSILDGTDGTVRVDTGAKFYIKSGSNGTKRWVRISTIQIDSSWIEVKRMLIDAYRCTVDTTDSSTPKTASVVNTSAEFRGGTNSSSYDSYLSTDVFRTQLGKPRTNVTRATMRTYAKNAGSQLLNYNDYKAVLYWLPVIEFATFNIQQSFNANPTSDGYKQGGLSAGVTNMGSTNWSNYNGYNPITPCGYANSLGNHTGVVTFTTPADSAASVTAVTHSIARWRGFENIFGDIWTNLDGILIEYNATIGKHDVYSCDNSEYFADSLNEHYTKIGEQIASDGYIGEFDLGESAEIIPSSVGGSTTTKKCDYSYQTTSAGLRTLRVGGGADGGGYAGLGFFNSIRGVGYAPANVGFRTSNYKD